MYGYQPYGYMPTYYNPSQMQQQPMQQSMSNQQIPASPQMAMPQIQQATQPPQNASGGDERIYVQGEGAAKAYLVAPGNTVTLWDTERQSIYIKTVNATGIPTMQRLDYTLFDGAEAPKKSTPEYEPRLKALENGLESLKKKFRSLEEAKRNESDADD